MIQIFRSTISRSLFHFHKSKNSTGSHNIPSQKVFKNNTQTQASQDQMRVNKSIFHAAKRTRKNTAFVELDPAELHIELHGEESLKVDPVELKSIDSTRFYINRAAKEKLLSREEEIELAQKVKVYVGFEKLILLYSTDFEEDKERPPSNNELAGHMNMSLRDFLQQRRYLQRSRDKMVEANLRLVLSLAPKYIRTKMDFDDLIQNGNLGLITAAEKFDHTKGYKFSTYATYWIEQAIRKGITKTSRTIRVPAHIHNLILQYRKIRNFLSLELDRTPSSEEIFQSIDKEREAKNEKPLTENSKALILQALKDIWSLDQPIEGNGDNSEESRSLLDHLVHKQTLSAEDAIFRREFLTHLKRVTFKDSTKAFQVIFLRYFSIPGEKRPYKEIKEILNLLDDTKVQEVQEVQEIHRKAIATMRQDKSLEQFTGKTYKATPRKRKKQPQLLTDGSHPQRRSKALGKAAPDKSDSGF